MVRGVFLVLYLIFSIILGVAITHSAGAAYPENFQQSMQTGKAFVAVHAGALAIWRLVILLVSILLAVWGTVKGWLPGTRKKPAAAA